MIHGKVRVSPYGHVTIVNSASQKPGNKKTANTLKATNNSQVTSKQKTESEPPKKRSKMSNNSKTSPVANSSSGAKSAKLAKGSPHKLTKAKKSPKQGRLVGQSNKTKKNAPTKKPKTTQMKTNDRPSRKRKISS